MFYKFLAKTAIISRVACIYNNITFWSFNHIVVYRVVSNINNFILICFSEPHNRSCLISLYVHCPFRTNNCVLLIIFPVPFSWAKRWILVSIKASPDRIKFQAMDSYLPVFVRFLQPFKCFFLISEHKYREAYRRKPENLVLNRSLVHQYLQCFLYTSGFKVKASYLDKTVRSIIQDSPGLLEHCHSLVDLPCASYTDPRPWLNRPWKNSDRVRWPSELICCQVIRCVR